MNAVDPKAFEEVGSVLNFWPGDTGLTDKITHRGLHFKRDKHEDKAAIEIQTQVKKNVESAVF